MQATHLVDLQRLQFAPIVQLQNVQLRDFPQTLLLQNLDGINVGGTSFLNSNVNGIQTNDQVTVGGKDVFGNDGLSTNFPKFPKIPNMNMGSMDVKNGGTNIHFGKDGGMTMTTSHQGSGSWLNVGKVAALTILATLMLN